MKSILLMFLLVFSVFAVPAAAGIFEDAVASERAGNYEDAVEKYRQVIAQDPGKAVAHRQLGTSLYRLGRKAEALDAYDSYLAANPSDTKTADFAARLRSSLAGQSSASSPASPGRSAFRNTGYATMFGGIAMLPAPAIPDEYASLVTSTTIETSLGTGFGAALGYQVANGIYLEMGYLSGPSRDITASDSSTTVDETLKDSSLDGFYLAQEIIYTAPGYNLLLGNSFLVGGQLGIGLASVHAANFGVSGIAILPELRAQKVFAKNFALGMGLGYQMSSLALRIGDTSTTGLDISEYVIDNSGLTFRLTLTGYFDPVLL